MKVIFDCVGALQVEENIIKIDFVTNDYCQLFYINGTIKDFKIQDLIKIIW